MSSKKHPFFLAGAKEQISYLTDEIYMKAEDNIAQQVGISSLYRTRNNSTI